MARDLKVCDSRDIYGTGKQIDSIDSLYVDKLEIKGINNLDPGHWDFSDKLNNLHRIKKITNEHIKNTK